MRSIHDALRRLEKMKTRPGYASLPACSLGERRIYRNQTHMSGPPSSGARQDPATEVTEITEGGGLVFMLCALCVLRWLNPDLDAPVI